MKHLAALLAVFACVACDLDPQPEGAPSVCLPREADPGPEHPLAQRLQAALEDAVDSGLPGVVLAVRDTHGTWEGSAGFVDLGRGEPMLSCHRTRIASVTKTFIATTVLSLAEEGLLDLDAPLSTLLPERTASLPNANRITTTQLLEHTSGVYNFLDVELVLDLFNRPDDTWSVEACYAHALDSDAEFSPGEDWSYSNTNYLLLGWIIEAVTGKPQEQVVGERILEPLELDETSYVVDSFDFEGVAHGYFDLMGDGALVDSTQNYANLCVGADGGMVSSARDLLTFFDHLLGQRDVLGEESLDRMMPSVETGDDNFPLYGAGVEAWGPPGRTRGIGHGGHEFGYRTFAYHFPEADVTLVIWFNASSLIPTDDNISKDINAARDKLRDIVLEMQ
ncbi:MAG: beta-lactamase family protein [Nannocystaceae bacterium]|nr:beta-lactamase family protein [Nannocystaceae bacterium]